MKAVGGIVNLTFNYIASVDKSEPTGFECMHGQRSLLLRFLSLFPIKSLPRNGTEGMDFAFPDQGLPT